MRWYCFLWLLLCLDLLCWVEFIIIDVSKSYKIPGPSSHVLHAHVILTEVDAPHVSIFPIRLRESRVEKQATCNFKNEAIEPLWGTILGRCVRLSEFKFNAIFPSEPLFQRPTSVALSVWTTVTHFPLARSTRLSQISKRAWIVSSLWSGRRKIQEKRVQSSTRAK